jgi:SAM-dependent methyltransferase
MALTHESVESNDFLLLQSRFWTKLNSDFSYSRVVTALSIYERYLKEADFRDFLRRLDLPDIEVLMANVEYFTEKEAEKRDEIVKGYFGVSAINTIVDEVAKNLQKLSKKSSILDVGAGTGFFTTGIAEKLAGRNFGFYAFDATPAMLNVLVKKLCKLNASIPPILGVAERINESITVSRKVYQPLGIELPSRYDAIISILMLHHCKNPSEVFNSMKRTLKPKGKLVLIDLCKHNFEEFRKKMGDIHLGFELNYVKNELDKIFTVERMEKMGEGCKCEESGRSAELFIAVAKS